MTSEMIENLKNAQEFYEEAPPTVQTELLADYAEHLLDTDQEWDKFHLFIYENNKDLWEEDYV